MIRNRRKRVMPDSGTWMTECLIRYLTMSILTMGPLDRREFMARMTRNQPEAIAKYIKREVAARWTATRAEARQKNAATKGKSGMVGQAGTRTKGQPTTPAIKGRRRKRQQA